MFNKNEVIIDSIHFQEGESLNDGYLSNPPPFSLSHTRTYSLSLSLSLSLIGECDSVLLTSLDGLKLSLTLSCSLSLNSFQELRIFSPHTNEA